MPGIPRPQGSKTPMRNRKTGKLFVIDSSGEGGRLWRQSVQVFAAQAFDGPLLTGPLVVLMRFVLSRPKGHYGSGKNEHKLKASAPKEHIKRADLLKLTRAVEDALTGIIYKDDAQIVEEHLRKHYCCEDAQSPGVMVTVRDIGNTDLKRRRD